MSQFHNPYGKDYEFPMHLWGELEAEFVKNLRIKDIFLALLSAMNAFQREKQSADDRRKALATAYTLLDKMEKDKGSYSGDPAERYNFFPEWSEKTARLLSSSAGNVDEVKEVCFEFRRLYDRHSALEYRLIDARNRIKTLEAENEFMLKLINEKGLGE